jgi:hypothetical protein
MRPNLFFRCCLAVLVWLTPWIACAQTSASEGIRAMAAGDYVTAGRLLQPLAERTQDADPLAQFFLAILSNTGRGVDGNPIETCTLFLRAATPANPFMNQSLALADDIRRSVVVGPDAPALCTVERDDRVPPITIRTAAASLSHAETAVAEGIDAFTLADYARAAEAFAPATKSSPPDPTAEFFLAAMYENGLGVPSDPMRACALYVRGSSEPSSALREASQSLVQSMGRRMGQDAFEDCMMYASLGFDTRFRPETFSLEPGHWISLDLRGATITYNGKDTRIPLNLGVQGAIFLPLQHTELMVGSSRSTRRHFIEVFMWLPSNKQKWTLLWRLFEVLPDKLEPITGEEVATADTPEPPAEPEFDVRQVVQLRVNDSGDAEWAVLNGPHEGSDQIASEAERQAAAEESRAQKESESRVDWTRIADLHRNPSLAYQAAEGCGNVFVFGWSADRTEAITIHADKELLRLSTVPLAIDSATHKNDLNVTVHTYERPLRSWPFCTDVVMGGNPEDTWTMVRGTVTITLSPLGVIKRAPGFYRATIQITGGQFMSSSGASVEQTRPITLTAVVGGMSG